MGKYIVIGWRKETASRVIEANSLEDAEEIAWDLDEEDFDWYSCDVGFEVDEA